MEDCNTIFEKMQEILPIEIVEKLVKETEAEKYTKKYTVMRQLITMINAQHQECKGLRPIEAAITSDKKLQEYTGGISYSQISRANRERDSEIFRAVFAELHKEVIRQNRFGKIPLNYGVLKALDSTLVRLCLKLFPWARYRNSTGAVKIHTLYDVLSGCPESIVLSDGLTSDKAKMSDFVTEPGVTYLFDRAYLDYREFDRYCKEGIYFVSRLKNNAVIKVTETMPITAGSMVLSDKKVILGCPASRMENEVRLVEVIDSSNGEIFHIVTNRFDLTAEEIADIYRLRWSIEVFFKWVKQHLVIKKFYGTSPNAILTQIYCALILYCLLLLIHSNYCKNADFLKMVRLIKGGWHNTISQLIHDLTPKRPPPLNKRVPPNWRHGYKEVLEIYGVCDQFV
jgi:hypothetical protein